MNTKVNNTADTVELEISSLHIENSHNTGYIKSSQAIRESHNNNTNISQAIENNIPSYIMTLKVKTN